MMGATRPPRSPAICEWIGLDWRCGELGRVGLERVFERSERSLVGRVVLVKDDEKRECGRSMRSKYGQRDAAKLYIPITNRAIGKRPSQPIIRPVKLTLLLLHSGAWVPSQPRTSAVINRDLASVMSKDATVWRSFTMQAGM